MDPEALNYVKVMSVLISGEEGDPARRAEGLAFLQSLEPWDALQHYVTAFQFMMQLRAGKPGALTMPHGKTPSEETDLLCDAWITMYLAAKDRRKIAPPPGLLRWLAARAFAAGIYLELEKENGDTPPDIDDMEGELKKRLVDLWRSDTRALWPQMDPKKGDPNYKGKKTGGRF